MISFQPTGIIREISEQFRDNHGACQAAGVCRTAPRIPQLTHRTFLLSLYRSTTDSSYIRVCGGLGDRLAEGVRQKAVRLLTSLQPDVHNEDPGFEVRVKQGHAHLVGLRPAAIPRVSASNPGGNHDCDF